MPKQIRVLIVDDSPLICEMISDVLRETSDLTVAGMAANGRQALAAFRDLKPDLITLDVQMPELDGLSTLDELLKIAPVPVIMVSSLTQLGAETTFTALERGALDYIGKPSGGADLKTAWKDELLRKIRQVAGCDVERLLKIRRERNLRRANGNGSVSFNAISPVEQRPASASTFSGCIALGISTGGPPALSSLFESLAGPLPPIVVVQHMPADFTKPFAWRLNSISSLTVKEAADGDSLQPNCVYVAPGGLHLSLVKSAGQVRCRIKDGETVSSHKPSVDVLMKSAAAIFGRNCLGVIMTGMGRDGVDGCRDIRAAGGYVLGQDEASSDVYGMNKIAFTSGHVDKQFSLDNAATVIAQHAKRLGAPAAVRALTSC